MSRKIITYLLYVLLSMPLLGAQDNKSFSVGATQQLKKVKDLQAKVQLAQIELRTLDQNVRGYQEELLNIKEKIDKNRLNLKELERDNPKLLVDHRALDKEISLAELGLLDDDSLESIGEQELILESLKKSFQEKLMRNDQSKLISRKFNRTQTHLSALYKVQKQIQNQLLRTQRKKALLSGGIENYRNQILSYEDFSLVEKAIERAQKVSSYAREALGTKLDSPIKEYASYQAEENGLKFKCYEECVLQSPGTGYIIYTGELIPYGRILIISHANEIRSVFLGEFMTKLKKGAKVYRGDIIGKTLLKKMGNIYFELRKNNKPIDILNKIPSI